MVAFERARPGHKPFELSCQNYFFPDAQAFLKWTQLESRATHWIRALQALRPQMDGMGHAWSFSVLFIGTSHPADKKKSYEINRSLFLAPAVGLEPTT